MSELPKSKWHRIKEQAETMDENTPVDNATRIKKLFLDTYNGSPVDTREELDSQLIHHGPIDTPHEQKSQDESAPTNKPKLGGG